MIARSAIEQKRDSEDPKKIKKKLKYKKFSLFNTTKILSTVNSWFELLSFQLCSIPMRKNFMIIVIIIEPFMWRSFSRHIPGNLGILTN